MSSGLIRGVLSTFCCKRRFGTHSSSVQRIAVYGTLRDDDNSGAAYTKQFLKDVTIAEFGTLHGAKMYRKDGVNYPFVVLNGNQDDKVVVRLLYWADPLAFQRQLNIADSIEGIADEKAQYQRVLVRIHRKSPRRKDNKKPKDSSMYAYCYVAKEVEKEWVALQSGDWLSRPS